MPPRGGAADRTTRLPAEAGFPARGLVALEDGDGIEVLAGSAASEVLERWLRRHARVMTGLPPECGAPAAGPSRPAT